MVGRLRDFVETVSGQKTPCSAKAWALKALAISLWSTHISVIGVRYYYKDRGMRPRRHLIPRWRTKEPHSFGTEPGLGSYKPHKIRAQGSAGSLSRHGVINFPLVTQRAPQVGKRLNMPANFPFSKHAD